MIDVGGISVPRAAVAQLAARLYREHQPRLADRLAYAVDQYVASIRLAERDAAIVLATLSAEPIEQLEPLRRKLLEPLESRR